MGNEYLTNKVDNIYKLVSSLNIQSTPTNIELMYSIFYNLKQLMEDINLIVNDNDTE